MSTSENNKRIAKNTLFLYFRMLFLMLVSLYTSRVVLDALGVDDYGIYNIVGGVITMFTFVSSAMTASTQRFLNFCIGKQESDELNRVFNASQIIHICFAIIVVLLAETIGLWFIYNKLIIPIERMDAAIIAFQCSVVATAFLILSYPYNAVIIARERMDVFAYVTIVEGLLKLVIAYVISVSCFDRLIYYAFLIMALQISISLVYRLYCVKYFQETKFKIKGISHKLYKSLLSFSGWNILGNVANVCLNQGVNIILNMFFGPAVNAARGISFQVQHAVNQFCSNFQTALNPQIVKSYAVNDLHYMHSLVFRASKFSFYLSLIFALPIMMHTQWIISLWLKDIPEYVCVFVQYTMVFSLIQALANPLLTGSMATGNVKKIMSVIAVFFWTVIPICYLALYMGYSPISVFQIQLVLYVVAHYMRIRIVSKQIGFSCKDYCYNVLFPVIKVAAFSFAMGWLFDYTLESASTIMIISSLIMMFVTCLLGIWLVGMDKQERNVISQFVYSKIKK